MNIGFLSTRLRGTDGVSLETSKWKAVLGRAGHRTFAFAGQLDWPADRSVLCENAFFGHPQVAALHQRVFGAERRSRADSQRLHQLKDEIKERLDEFITHFQLDLLIPQNILAIPMNLSLGMALVELYHETRIPVVAHHHDFFWERERFSPNAVGDILETAFPPAIEQSDFRHVVINSEAQDELARRRGITATLIPNVFDFHSPPPPARLSVAEVRRSAGIPEGDLLLLQPTRVVPRKGIELTIDLALALQEKGRPATVLITHEAGDEGSGYLRSLKSRAEAAGVRLRAIGDRVTDTANDGSISLWDLYPACDLVAYPSLYEGFGNALLEAFHFRKPVMVNRYDVFRRDIEPAGVDVIGIDRVITAEVVERVVETLEQPRRATEMVEQNHRVGCRHFSYRTLEERLLPLVEGAASRSTVSRSSPGPA